MTANTPIIATITLTNTGTRDGKEVVQMYIRDMVGSVMRPVRALKGFQKVMLKAGESRTISFPITQAELSFYRKDMTWGTKMGKFQVFIGANAETTNGSEFISK